MTSSLRTLLCLASWSLVAATSLPASAKAQDVKIDTSGKGAVLCTYSIYTEIEVLRRACFPDDTETASMLSDVLAAHRDFIARNSDQTLDDLTTRERTYLNRVASNAPQCDTISPDVMAMYKGLTGDPAATREAVRDQLSVDREPLMNPCL